MIGERGSTYGNGPAKPITAVDVMAGMEKMKRELAPIRAELDWISADLFGAIAIAAAKHGCSWDEAARRTVAKMPPGLQVEFDAMIDEAREWGRRGGRR